MNDLTQKLILTIVVVPILLAIFRGPKEMTIAVAAIGIALAFANLDKIESFKTGIMEAKLRTAVNDAYAAIAQLRELGVALSAPIVDDLAVSGRIMQFIPLKYKLQRVQKIEDTLKKLGANDQEIAETTATIYQRVASDHVSSIMRSLKEANLDKADLFNGLIEKPMHDWDDAKITKFIKDNNLKTSTETSERIKDFDFFIEHKKLRREELWQS